MKLLRMALLPMALTFCQAATAATFNYSSPGSVSATGYSSTVGGITANVTASGNKLSYYALAPGLGNSGCHFGICSAAIQNTESLTVTFSQAVTMSSLKIAAWDSADSIKLTASNGNSSILNNGPFVATVGDFNLSGLGQFTSLTIAGASFTSVFSLRGMDVAPVSSVPVPGAALLMGSGLLSLAGWVKRKQARR